MKMYVINSKTNKFLKQFSSHSRPNVSWKMRILQRIIWVLGGQTPPTTRGGGYAAVGGGSNNGLN
jgi:hypothetical protein